MSALGRVDEIALPVVVRVLRRLPYPVAERVLIGLSLGQAIVDPGLIRRAYAWAAGGGAGTRSARAVALGLLVHRARALAAGPRMGLLDPDQARQRLEVRGRDRLDEAGRRGGVILLGFHMGLVGLHHALALVGYTVTAIGGGSRFRLPPVTAPWQAFGDRSRMHGWTDAEPGSRADALYRLHQVAAAGGIVMIMGSSGRGRVLFDLPLPGRPLAVRTGWFVLRRLTDLPTLPVLAHWEGDRWVVTIHPALPATDPDEGRDREACREALAQVLGGFVARFPEQCSFLAMRTDQRPPPVPGRLTAGPGTVGDPPSSLPSPTVSIRRPLE